MVLDFAVEFERQVKKVLPSVDIGLSVVLMPTYERVYFETESEAEDWLELFRTVAPDCYNFKLRKIREG